MTHWRRSVDICNLDEFDRRGIALRIERNSTWSGQCLIWNAKIGSRGYGYMKVGPRGHNAHRVAYAVWVGFTEETRPLEIDHLCHVRACVNPTHLEAVTHAENLRRRNLDATQCRHGHDQKEHGYLMKDGRRRCRVCQTEQQRRYLANRRLRRQQKEAS